MTQHTDAELTTLYTIIDDGKYVFDYKKVADMVIKDLKMINHAGDIYVYDDGVYVQDIKCTIVDRYILEILMECGFPTTCPITKTTKEITHWAKKFCPNSHGIYPCEFHQNILNIKNGVIIFDNDDFIFDDHKDQYKFPYKLPVSYNSEADATEPDEFFKQFGENNAITLLEIPAVACLMQIHQNYSFKTSYLIHGAKDAGKTTYINLLNKKIFGENNCSNQPLHKLCGDRFSKGRLVGKIANIYDDLPNANVEIGEFKTITGGGIMDVELKHANPFAYHNTAVMIYASNQYPNIVDGDEAFWSRWIFCDMTKTFPRVPNFEQTKYTDKFTSGTFNLILNKMVEIIGNDYTISNNKTPWTELREKSMMENDILYKWIIDNLETCNHAVLPKSDCYAAFYKYCVDNGIKDDKIPSKFHFGKRMSGFGYGSDDDNDRVTTSDRRVIRAWKNVKFKDRDPIYQISSSQSKF